MRAGGQVQRFILALLYVTLIALAGCGGGGGGGSNSFTSQNSGGVSAGLPRVTISALPVGVVGIAYSATLTATNGVPPYSWSVSAPGLPGGLLMDASSGKISGVPTQSGSFPITVLVTDSSAQKQTSGADLTLGIANPLQLIANPLSNATQNQNYLGAGVSVLGGWVPIVYTISAGSLPPGIKLDSSHGSFGGVPYQRGSFTFTVHVQDSSSPPQTAEQQTSITVVPEFLSLQSSLPPSVPLGVAFQGMAAARGGVPPYSWSVQSGNLPPGLQLDSATGAVSGTPTATGNYSFTIQVNDTASPAQVSSLLYYMSVQTALGRNDSIAKATPIGSGSFYASISPYADPVDIANPDADYYRLVATGGAVVTIRVNGNDPLDSVLELVDSNGVRLSTCQQPSANGTFTKNTFTDSCMNDDINPGIIRNSALQFQAPGNSPTQTTFYAHVLDWRGDARPDMTYNLQVDGALDPLKISTATLPNAGVGVAYNQNLAATGGTSPVAWNLLSGSLPSGLVLANGGVLSGTPTIVGSFNFTVQAVDSSNPPQSANKPFTILVENPPKITTAVLPDAVTGEQYNKQIDVTAGTPPFSWVASIPWTGLSLTQSGVLQGVAFNTGTFQIQLTVTDSLGQSDSRTLALNIKPGPLTLQGSAPNGRVGYFYNYTPVTNGGTPPYNYTVASGSLPPGISLVLPNPSLIVGVPTTAGTYSATLRATDSASPPQQAALPLTFTIDPY